MIIYFAFVDATDKIIKDLHAEAVELLKQKCNDQSIIEFLMKKGVDRHYAEMILENVKSDKSDTKEFYKHLLGGSFTLLAGITVTLGTYSIAKPGGIYLVFAGLMVYGIVTICRAFILFRK